MVENHWLNEMGRERQRLELDVSELLVVGTQIWIGMILFSLAVDLKMTSDCSVAQECGTLCGWVCCCVKVTAASAGLMETCWRFYTVSVDLVNS